ncbi:MAG: BrnT family toxin [bacterium]|nr:BrnT family toxin [bacterium]
MDIEYDQDKREFTLRQRGLDFADAREVFAGPVLTDENVRHAYGEPRFISMGVPKIRIVVLVWTPRNGKCRIISMRYANEREREKYTGRLG